MASTMYVYILRGRRKNLRICRSVLTPFTPVTKFGMHHDQPLFYFKPNSKRERSKCGRGAKRIFVAGERNGQTERKSGADKRNGGSGAGSCISKPERGGLAELVRRGAGRRSEKERSGLVERSELTERVGSDMDWWSSWKIERAGRNGGSETDEAKNSGSDQRSTAGTYLPVLNALARCS